MLEVTIETVEMDMTKVCLIFNGDQVDSFELTPLVMNALREHFANEVTA